MSLKNNNKSVMVSIMCNTYNQVDFIRDAIEGFLKQDSSFPVEVLIHDDASDDGTTDIIKEYEERNKEIIEYFKDKPNQLLVLDIIKGEGWENLCTFLGKDIPDVPFPHENIGKYQKK